MNNKEKDNSWITKELLEKTLNSIDNTNRNPSQSARTRLINKLTINSEVCTELIAETLLVMIGHQHNFLETIYAALNMGIDLGISLKEEHLECQNKTTTIIN